MRAAMGASVQEVMDAMHLVEAKHSLRGPGAFLSTASDAFMDADIGCHRANIGPQAAQNHPSSVSRYLTMRQNAL